MTLLHDLAFTVHLAVGVCALLVFWVPLFTRKGALNHRRFGRAFAWVMYAVAGTGMVMSLVDIHQPLASHAPGLSVGAAEAGAVIRQIRTQALFLFSLSVLVLTTTRHGWLVALYKNDRRVLRRPAHVGLCTGLLVVGLGLSIVGWQGGQILLMVFGVFEMIIAGNYLRFIYKAGLGVREWVVEHLGALIGSGIGAYTAFFVFGGTRLFQSLFQGSFSDASIVLWVAPGVLGGVAIAVLSRRHGRGLQRR